MIEDYLFPWPRIADLDDWLDRLSATNAICRKSDPEPLIACPHSVHPKVLFFSQFTYFEECDSCLRERIMESLK